MSFFNLFRGFFGMPPDGHAHRLGDLPEERSPNEFRNPIWSQDDDDDDDEDFSFLNRGPRYHSFSVNSNLVDIHRFFEQELENIMKSFGAFGFGNFGNSGNFDNFGSGGTFSLEPPPMESDLGPFKGSLREQFLKPGYEHDSDREKEGRKMDHDLDDEYASAISKILRQGPHLDVIEPKRAEPFSSITRNFGQSMTSRTMTRPNGGVEHHKSVRDSSGNEEVTVTRTIGGQSYSVTTKTDAKGKQERIENFVNMDEGELKNFQKKWGGKW